MDEMYNTATENILKEMRKLGDDRPHSEMREWIQRKRNDGISYDNIWQLYIAEKFGNGIPMSKEQQHEAMKAAFAKETKKIKENVEADELGVHLLNDKEKKKDKFDFTTEKAIAMQMRSIANRRFVDYMNSAKWAMDRRFGVCVAILKDE